MKAFINDIIPKIKRFSQKIDDLTLLTNKHWITIDEFSDIQTKYIFLTNNELIISINGNAKKALWEYVGKGSIVINFAGTMKLLNIDFYDTYILALRIDDSHNYTLLINESLFKNELITLNKVTSYLQFKYLQNGNMPIESHKLTINSILKYKTLKTNLGVIKIELTSNNLPIKGNKVFINNESAPDGDYRVGVGWYYKVKGGIIIEICK